MVIERFPHIRTTIGDSGRKISAQIEPLQFIFSQMSNHYAHIPKKDNKQY